MILKAFKNKKMATKTVPEWQAKLMEVEAVGYGSVKMIADGYNVTFKIVRVGNRLQFTYFIDGLLKGEFTNADSPIGQKFGLPIYHNISQKLYGIILICEGEKAANYAKEKAAKRVIGYRAFFKSAASVIRTLKRTCQDIKLVEE